MKRSYAKRFLILVIIFILVASMAFGEPSQLVTLHFKNADIKDILRALADQEGVSFLIDNEVSGTATIHLTKVSFNDALDIITKNNGLTYTRENKVYRITKVDNSSLTLEYKDGLLSIAAREVRLKLLLETISQKTGVNLVPAPELQDRIDIILNNAPLADGIRTILTQANCIEEKINSVSYIRKKATENYPFTINFQNNQLTIDAQNVPAQALARAITEKTGVSVVPEQSLSQNISVYLQNLPLDEALSILCDANNLQLIKENNSWQILRKNGAYRVKVKDNQLSVDADGVDLTAIINEISRQSGVNLMVAKEVRESVTAHFQNLPLFQGITMMLDSRNLILEKHAKYYLITANRNRNENIKIAYDPDSGLFDLDLQSAPIATVLDEMAQRADLNIVILSQVNWTINNIRLQKLKFTEVLDYLLKGTIFTYMLSNDTYVIGDGLIVRPENADFATVKIYPIKYLKVDQLLNTLPPVFPRQNFVQLPEKNAMIVTAPAHLHTMFTEYLEQVDVANIEDRTEVIKIKYLKADDVLKLIPPSIPKNDVVVVKEMNALVVTGPQNLVNQVKQYIEKIDQVNPMIVFDIMVLSINDTDDTKWTPPASTLQGLVAINSEKSIKDVINLMVSNNVAKILQHPIVSTLNGYQTSFKVSTKRSYNMTDSKDSNGNITYKTVNIDEGLFVTITPWVSANNQITMEIKPTFSEFRVPELEGQIAITNERSTETTIRVSDKQTVMISGLKKQIKDKKVTKVPLLGDIPLIGFLFKNSSVQDAQEEFVIVITPHLIYDDKARNELTKSLTQQFTAEFQDSYKTDLEKINQASDEQKPEPSKSATTAIEQ